MTVIDVENLFVYRFLPFHQTYATMELSDILYSSVILRVTCLEMERGKE